MTEQTPDRDHGQRRHEETNVPTETLPVLANQEYVDARATEREIRLQMGLNLTRTWRQEWSFSWQNFGPKRSIWSKNIIRREVQL